MEEKCQSCGIKLDSGFYGTNTDDTINNEYCKYCFEKGVFREPNLTIDEMMARKAAEIKDNLGINNEEAENLAIKTILYLRRWKKNQ